MGNSDVVVKHQDEIRVFRNEDGGISIAQSNAFDDDVYIYFSIEYAELVAKAILAEAGKNA